MEKYRDNDPGKEQTAYDRLSDEALLRQLRAGDAAIMDYVLDKYKPLVRKKTNAMFLIGGDTDDLIQEGMLGLLAAIRGFQSGKESSFRTYAEICVRSRLYAAVRAAQRDKHFPLNHSVSFETPLFDGTNAYLFSSEESPEDVIIGREELRERLAALKGQLSEFEAKILPPYLSGLSCGEIAQRVGRPQKSVDNAIQRVRRKVARQFSSSGSSES